MITLQSECDHLPIPTVMAPRLYYFELIDEGEEWLRMWVSIKLTALKTTGILLKGEEEKKSFPLPFLMTPCTQTRGHPFCITLTHLFRREERQ